MCRHSITVNNLLMCWARWGSGAREQTEAPKPKVFGEQGKNGWFAGQVCCPREVTEQPSDRTWDFLSKERERALPKRGWHDLETPVFRSSRKVEYTRTPVWKAAAATVIMVSS